jgi:ABC-type phosphate transport system permease subunit
MIGEEYGMFAMVMGIVITATIALIITAEVSVEAQN